MSKRNPTNPNTGGRPRKDSLIIGEEELRKMRKILTKHTEEACLILTNAMVTANTKGDVAEAVKLAMMVLDKTITVQRELERKGAGNTRRQQQNRDDDEAGQRGAVLSLVAGHAIDD